MLALGISNGFSDTWDGTQPQGSHRAGLDDRRRRAGLPTATYRVGTLSFLADGGDPFTAFTGSTIRLGGGEDLANLVASFESHPGLTAPADRVGSL